jgi:diaminopimelate epimerase
MKLAFSKVQGAGNDFVMADDSDGHWPRTPDFIKAVCERRLGVGADGLILLSRKPSGLRMDYYNSDGSEAALCGNGLRCAALFARACGLSSSDRMEFSTASGTLSAELLGSGLVRIRMPLSEPFKRYDIDPEFTIYKGSVGVPHAVIPVPSIDRVDVKLQGRRFRFHKAFLPEGANVDFIELPDSFSKPVKIRTYERGVEDETWACGTGIASAAVCARLFLGAPDVVDLLCVAGAVLRIELICKDNIVKDAHLTGPAGISFSGALESGDFAKTRNA